MIFVLKKLASLPKQLYPGFLYLSHFFVGATNNKKKYKKIREGNKLKRVEGCCVMALWPRLRSPALHLPAIYSIRETRFNF
jgi:hypothetical protein